MLAALAATMPGPVNPASPATIRTAIATAAVKAGVDFDYLYGQARIESSLDPAARARTSSAAGLFQFTRATWLATLDKHGAANGFGWAADAITAGRDGRHRIDDPRMRDAIDGLRYDPEASSLMAASFASDNRAHLEIGLGRSVEPVDLYLAHFLGPAGALKFLKAHDADHDASAASVFPEAAAANRTIFYGPDGARSFGEIRNRFAAKLGREPAPLPTQPLQIARRSESTGAVTERPLAMLGIEPMPQQLSPDFVARAYRRLRGDSA